MWVEQTKLKALTILRVHGQKLVDKFEILQVYNQARQHSKKDKALFYIGFKNISFKLSVTNDNKNPI